MPTYRHAQHGQKDDDADTVVEQRFACNRRLDALWRMNILKDAEHGDGVSRRDERSKDEGVDVGEVQAQNPGDEPEQRPCRRRGYEHADCGKRRDGCNRRAQPREVDVERAREEQVAKQAV